MKIILKKEVANLGYAGDIVEVKTGYALNYLIPQGFATTATKSAIKQLEEVKRQRAHKEAQFIEEANVLAAKVREVKIQLSAKVSESGKIYGSITTAQLAEAFAKQGLEIDKKDIVIVSKSIKSLGEFEAYVSCYRGVKGEFTFEVIAE